MNARSFTGLIAFVVTVVLGHELALRAMLEYDAAGSLLALGGEPPMVLLAAGTLLLRMLAVASLSALPAVVVWRLCRTRNALSA